MQTDERDKINTTEDRGVRQSDSVHVAWQDSRNGSPDIYFNNSTGALPYGAATAGSGSHLPALSLVSWPLIGNTVS